MRERRSLNFLLNRQKRSVFETRVDVLEAVRILGDDAISSRIAVTASVSQNTLGGHLAFLQLKDLVTVADHTIAEREKLQKRSKSSIFRITPEGRRVLSILIPIRDELTSDKRRNWNEALRREESQRGFLLSP